MLQKKDNWVLGIEQEISKARYKRILWGLVLLSSSIIFYFLYRTNIFGDSTGVLNFILIVSGVIAFFKFLESPNKPNYLANYLYQIGYELPDFENEENYLKRNKKYLKDCSEQIEYIRNNNFGQTEYFVGDILVFLDSLESIILHLNDIYSRIVTDEKVMAKLDGMSSEQYITEREFISSNLIALANLIHKEYSTLTQEHINLANKILNELKDIPEKPFNKPISIYIKEKWDKLPFKIKFLIFGAIVFGVIFIILYKILIYIGVEEKQASIPAISASAILTAPILAKIDWFITR